MTNSKDLPACPFCGETQLRLFLNVPKGRVQCINEDCEHCYKNPMTIEAWSKRPLEDKLRLENNTLRMTMKDIANTDLDPYIAYKLLAYCVKIATQVLKSLKEI